MAVGVVMTTFASNDVLEDLEMNELVVYVGLLIDDGEVVTVSTSKEDVEMAIRRAGHDLKAVEDVYELTDRWRAR
jgi:hypothetical protein